MATMPDEPRVVAAGRGAAWWGEGWRIFTPSIFTWVGIILVYMLVAILISMIPYVDNVGHWLLTPVFTAGLMVGCRAVSRGERLRVAHFFEGFQSNHFVPLIIIGAVNIAIVLAIIGIATFGIVGAFRLTDALRMGAMGDPLGTLGQMATRIGLGEVFATLLVLVIATLSAMLNWFAPALVILHGMKPLEAMKKSFVACWRNWLPFLVYGVVAVLLAIVAVLVLGGLILGFGVTALLNDGTRGLSAVVGIVGVLGLLVVIMVLAALPVVFGATYAGYRDIFAGDEGAALPKPA